MPTFLQLIKYPRVRPRRKTNSPALQQNPQKKAVCLRVFITTPRKPNSAKRKVARVRLSSQKNITISIPGTKHTLQKHSKVLVRGGNVRDIPSVRYRAIRGKFDLRPWFGIKKKRSKYGVKNVEDSL